LNAHGLWVGRRVHTANLADAVSEAYADATHCIPGPRKAGSGAANLLRVPEGVSFRSGLVELSARGTTRGGVGRCPRGR
jgi:hypothetical protein